MGEEVRILLHFKEQIFRCIELVCDMKVQDRLTAVQLWNEVSVRLQAFLESSNADENTHILNGPNFVQELRKDVEQTIIDDTTIKTVLGLNQVDQDKGEEDNADSIHHQSTGKCDTEEDHHVIIANVDEAPHQHDIEHHTGNASEEVSGMLSLSEDGETHLKQNFIVIGSETVISENIASEEEDQDEDDLEEEIEEEEQEVEEEKVVQGREKVIVLQNSDLSINFAHNNIEVLTPDEMDSSMLENKVFEIRRKQSLLLNSNIKIKPNPAVKELVRKDALNAVIKKDGTEIVTYSCATCNKTFPSIFAHTAHSWCHSKPFNCETCGRSFASKGSLVIHNRKHTGEKPFQCKTCPAKFSTHGNLKRHSLSHTGVRPFACSVCDSRFAEKKSLTTHMRVHTGEKPFACSLCDQRFTQAGTLKAHMTVHNKKKPHLCDLCGRSFSQKSNLKAHKSRHFSQRNFNCDYCASKFHNKGDLMRHMKGHTGVKNLSLVCPVCMKSFARRNTWTDHMNKHNNIKPWQCALCHEQFFTRSQLKQHLKERSDSVDHAALKDQDSDTFVLNVFKQDDSRVLGQQEVVNHEVILGDIDEDDPDDVEEDIEQDVSEN